jgi:hypothetical protein
VRDANAVIFGDDTATTGSETELASLRAWAAAPLAADVTSLTVSASALPATMTATVNGGSPPYTYSWTGPGGFNSTDQNITVSTPGTYNVTVTESGNYCTATNSGTLTVVQPPAITEQPVGRTNDAGTVATFSVWASGTPPFTYQWQKDGSNLANVGNVLGATNWVLRLDNVSSNDTAAYSVIVANSAGSVTSQVATLSVAYAPRILSAPMDYAASLGGCARFAVAASGAQLNYQWRFNGVNIAAATSDTLILPSVQVTDAGVFDVVASNPSGATVSGQAVLSVAAATTAPFHQSCEADWNHPCCGVLFRPDCFGNNNRFIGANESALMEVGRLFPEWEAVERADPEQEAGRVPSVILEGTVASDPSDPDNGPHVSFEDSPSSHYTHDFTFKVIPDEPFRHLLGIQRHKILPGFATPIICESTPQQGVECENLTCPELDGKPVLMETQRVIEVEWESGLGADYDSRVNPFCEPNIRGDSGGFYSQGHHRGDVIWQWPTIGDRVHVEGFWAWDRSHPPAETEIHPPRLVATTRHLPFLHRSLYPAGFVLATRTDVFASGDGNALRNNRGLRSFVRPVAMRATNYTFEIIHSLPAPSPTAHLAWSTETHRGDSFPCDPIIVANTYRSDGERRTLPRNTLRVTIPWHDCPEANETNVFARTILLWWTDGDSVADFTASHGVAADYHPRLFKVTFQDFRPQLGATHMLEPGGCTGGFYDGFQDAMELRVFVEAGGNWLFLNDLAPDYTYWHDPNNYEHILGKVNNGPPDNILAQGLGHAYDNYDFGSGISREFTLVLPPGGSFRVHAGGWEADGANTKFGNLVNPDSPCTCELKDTLNNLLTCNVYCEGGRDDPIGEVNHVFRCEELDSAIWDHYVPGPWSTPAHLFRDLSSGGDAPIWTDDITEDVVDERKAFALDYRIEELPWDGERLAAGGCPRVTPVVTTLNDDGPGSLRWVLGASREGDLISFAPNVVGAIHLTGGELAVDHGVKILGPGSAQLAINADGTGRVFNIRGGSSFISGLTITGGYVQGPEGPVYSDGGFGGGIYVGASACLTLLRCEVATNTVAGRSYYYTLSGSIQGGLGGGVYNAGSLTLIDCWIHGNVAQGGDSLNASPAGLGAGGGLYNVGTLRMTGCTFSDNLAQGGAGATKSGQASGGALYTFSGPPLQGCFLTEQLLAQYPELGDGSASSGRMFNCTFSGNSATGGPGVGPGAGQGGGLYLKLSQVGPGEMLMNCTISANTASGGRPTGGQVALGAGGGLFVPLSEFQTTKHTVWNTIIAGNTTFQQLGGSMAGSPDVHSSSSTFASAGGNLIGDLQGSEGFGPTDLIGDPKLEQLKFNGGPTPTMALRERSPAIDAGENGVLFFARLRHDQRGYLRPVQGATAEVVDIGAFEYASHSFDPVGIPTEQLTGETPSVDLLAGPADVVGFPGRRVAFSVVANGKGLAYQWRKGGVSLPDCGNASGASSPTLVLANISPSDAGEYTVLVADSSGIVRSFSASLTVVEPPLIVRQPVDRQSAAGTTATFTAKASDGASFQWQKNGTNLVDGGSISGATTATLAIANISQADAGSYTLVVVNTAGIVTSTAATLTVVNPPLITAQPCIVGTPPVEWQRAFGGSLDDALFDLQQLPDGGFILAGASKSSTNGNRTSPHPVQDSGENFWLVRLDAAGNKLWDHAYSCCYDNLSAVQPTADGGFMLAGNNGQTDMVLMKVDSNGNFLWRKDFGGDQNDIVNALQPTSDGGFLLVGKTFSSQGTGTKTSPFFGSYDGWVVRVDANGNELWQRAFGGSGMDILTSIAPAPDGGFMLGGWSSSPGTDGNKTSPNQGGIGFEDFWLIRIDANGNKLWEQTYGGSCSEMLWSLKPAADGGFILGGESCSVTDGNKSSPKYGAYDAWVVRVDANGNKLWDRSFGGSNGYQDWESIYSLQETADGGIILGGRSDSGMDGNKTSPNYGGVDCWLIRLDRDGNKLWEQSYGGSGFDTCQSLRQTADGGFILGGYSDSPADGNKTVPGFGGLDMWVIKLGSDTNQTFNAGATVILTVGASGTGSLSYQWFRDGVAVPGATEATLTLSNAQAGDVGAYTVVISNSGGSITSSPATLAVHGAPAITSQPQTQTAVVGATVTLAVEASGTAPLAYQWLKNGVSLYDSARISGTGTPTLTITQIHPGEAGNYSVVVSNSYGFVLSSNAALSVLLAPPAITQQPVSQVATQGERVSLTAAAIGTPPLYYQWTLDGLPIRAGTSPAYTLASAQPGDQGEYSLTVSNAAGVAVSSNATITLLLPPSIYQQPGSLVVTQSRNATFIVGAGGTPPLSYQWLLDGTNLPGATSFRYSIKHAQIADAGSYTVAVSNRVGVVVSDPAMLTIREDTTSPTILSVTPNCDRNNIVIRASEPLDPAASQDIRNYVLSPALPILAVRSDPDAATISLITAPFASDTPYTLSIQNLRDLSGNVMAGSSRFSFACPAGAPPVLSMAGAGAKGTVSWSGANYVLQRSAAVTGPWEDFSPGIEVANLKFNVEVTLSDPSQFYRLARQPRPFTYSVSASLQPSQAALPGLDGGPPRSVGVVLGADGHPVELVENEVIFHPRDSQELAAFLAKYNGWILRDGTAYSIPEAPKRAGFDPSPVGWYLIRVDLNQSGTSDLVVNMRAMGVPGPVVFSSEAAARLVALKVRESQLALDANILLHPHQVPEQPMVGGGCTDAEKWWYMTDDSDPLIPADPGYPGLSIGVIHAWRYLQYLGVPPDSGEFAPPILAIIDGGFALSQTTGLPLLNNADYPNYNTKPELQADIINTGPFAGGANPATCSGGNACPWHGQQVFGIAAAVPRNCFGTAGIGGPVAIPMLYKADDDLWVHADGIRWAAYNGASVINISYGGGCGAYAGLCHAPPGCGGAPCDPYSYMQQAVTAATEFGAIIVASAGNDGLDITGSDDPIPAKSTGVIGVGAVNRSGTRSLYANGKGSNYGADVDIWAPDGTWTTITPGSPTQIQMFSGTSASAPFIAGVVALMKAVDPSLRSDEVQKILQQTCIPSTDPTVQPGWVNAYRALQAVRPNLPPTVKIRRPSNASTISWNRPELWADVVDPEQGGALDGVTIQWISSRDGVLCSGLHRTFCQPPILSLGTHVITVNATDPFGAVGSDSVIVSVINEAPVVSILSPASGQVCADLAVSFFGSTFDPEGQPISRRWFDNGSLLSTYLAFQTEPFHFSQGSHTITLEADDGMPGGASTASIELIIGPPCGFPSARITSPGNGTMIYAGTDITLMAQASDPQDGPLTGASLEWRSDIDGFLGTGTSLNVVLSGCAEPCHEYVTHTITLTATDSGGSKTSAQISVYVGAID